MPTRTIHVELLDEAVAVWRPVEAEELLPGQASDDERWAFPLDRVSCARRETSA
jgi:hypothetical protein